MPAAALPPALLHPAAAGQGLRAGVRHEGPEVRTVLALVRSGLGPALLPRSAAEAAPGDPLRLPEAGPLHAVRCTEGGPDGGPGGRSSAGPPAGVRPADLADALRDAPTAALPPALLHPAAAGQGLRAGVRHEGPEVRTVLALVRSGLGPALLPRSAAEGAAGVAVVPLTAPRLVHRTEVLHRGGAGGAAAVLTGLLTGAPVP
ncbi:hypothetical protein PV350_14110 [Streptomyces sp. PA03-6a]|nr:hypothetical protein [Streptomyces sp. PA03-6a]